MDDAERELVISTWNDTAQPYPESSTAHELFELQASKTPDAVALVFEGEEVSYKELMVYTSRLAARLQGHGVRGDSVVGLCVEKSIEEVGGMVGIMRSGGAYVPLDPKLPVDRVRFLVEQCECGVVAVQEKHSELVGSLGVDVEVLEAAMYSEGDGRLVDRECDCRSLAYVLFT